MRAQAVRLRHRWWNRLRAEVAGFFWLPCVQCGQMWGGHEFRYRGQYTDLPVDRHPGTFHTVCPACGFKRDPTPDR